MPGWAAWDRGDQLTSLTVQTSICLPDRPAQGGGSGSSLPGSALLVRQGKEGWPPTAREGGLLALILSFSSSLSNRHRIWAMPRRTTKCYRCGPNIRQTVWAVAVPQHSAHGPVQEGGGRSGQTGIMDPDWALPLLHHHASSRIDLYNQRRHQHYCHRQPRLFHLPHATMYLQLPLHAPCAIFAFICPACLTIQPHLPPLRAHLLLRVERTHYLPRACLHMPWLQRLCCAVPLG